MMALKSSVSPQKMCADVGCWQRKHQSPERFPEHQVFQGPFLAHVQSLKALSTT